MLLNLTRISLGLTVAILLGAPSPAVAESPPRPAQAALSHVGSMPVRGMSMAEVARHFGAPVKKSAAVGQPPISQWHYDGFVVYFEYSHVIHALATDN